MNKFKPVAYNEGDFRAFKYIGSSDIQEGYLCVPATGPLSEAMYCDLKTGTYDAGGEAGATLLTQIGTGHQIFPVLKYDPDIESIGATISQDDFVTGYFGDEWEVYYDACEVSAAASFTALTKVAVASTGKFAVAGGRNATDYIIAEVLAVNNGWVHMKKV